MRSLILKPTLALLLCAAGGLSAQDVPAPVPVKPVVKTAKPVKAVKAVPKPKAATPTTPKRPRKKIPVDQLVDLNKASKEKLMKLPGITPKLADAIIAGRPYLSKAHIVTHNVVPQATYQAISNQIMVTIDPAWLPKNK